MDCIRDRQSIVVAVQQCCHVTRCLDGDEQLGHAHWPVIVVDAGNLGEFLGEIERRVLVVEEAGNPTTAQKCHGLKGLHRGVHGIKTVRRQRERIGRRDARHEEDEAAGQLALPVLVFRAVLGVAKAAVVGARDRLASAENADDALAVGIPRHWCRRHAVANLPIGRVLRPEAPVVRAPRNKPVRHHGVPVVGRENGRKTIQTPDAVAPVFAECVEQLCRGSRIGKVTWSHREIGHVLRHQRHRQIRNGLRDVARDIVERAVGLHTMFIQRFGARIGGSVFGEDLDAGADFTGTRNKAWPCCRRCWGVHRRLRSTLRACVPSCDCAR